MSVYELDIQKIEQLLNSATSERQRKMYKSLLDKARSQELSSTSDPTPETTPETEKKTQTKTNHSTETKTKTKTTLKQKKSTRQSATTEAPTPTTEPCQPILESTTLPQSSDLPSQTELKSKSEKPQQQHSDEEPRIFQALGTILAAPYLKSDRLKVTIDGRSYDLLYVKGFQRRSHRSLKAELEKNGSKEMFLKLYPQATFDQSSAEPILSFSVANFSLDCEKLNNYPKGFVLRGIWQYIPQCKFPVISIYRNRNQLPAFKKLNAKQQFHFAKPHHIPVVWSATIEPFKYNPSVEKSEQMPRYFVEVRAVFKDGLYVVEEMLRSPTVDIPKLIKVSIGGRS